MNSGLTQKVPANMEQIAACLSLSRCGAPNDDGATHLLIELLSGLQALVPSLQAQSVQLPALHPAR